MIKVTLATHRVARTQQIGCYSKAYSLGFHPSESMYDAIWLHLIRGRSGFQSLLWHQQWAQAHWASLQRFHNDIDTATAIDAFPNMLWFFMSLIPTASIKKVGGQGPRIITLSLEAWHKCTEFKPHVQNSKLSPAATYSFRAKLCTCRTSN